jgi:hypothetical protein
VAATPLNGARIGISSGYFAGLDPEVERVSNEALQKLSAAGRRSSKPSFPKRQGQEWTLR